MDVILPLYYLVTAHQSQRGMPSYNRTRGNLCPVPGQVQLFLLAQTREDDTSGTFVPIHDSGAHLFGYGMVSWRCRISVYTTVAHIRSARTSRSRTNLNNHDARY
jgi:hypothetical protein